METTKNKMPEYANNFFNKLRNYLDTKLYFYGSIQRNDYFPKSSDIDVDIFTPNVSTTITQIKSFLGKEDVNAKHFLYKLVHNNRLVSGYKIKIKRLLIKLNIFFFVWIIFKTILYISIIHIFNIFGC